MRLLRFSILATLALCLSAGSAGADTFPPRNLAGKDIQWAMRIAS